MDGARQAFVDQTVVISGGSKGLGLALAREFGRQGASVAIFARHQDEVEQAAAGLRVEGLRVEGFVCDVTQEDEVNALMQTLRERFGRIDVLVNNAGIIQVGPAESMTKDDFKLALDTMLWGMIHATLAVLPGMKAVGRGRIVNITSIGGKVSVPHLLPYNTAKFAAVGFSEGLQPELNGSGVKVVTVVPGLMRTGSFLNALFKGESREEFRWFAVASSTPMLSMPAEDAARRIVRATERGERELILSLPANLLSRFKGLFPGQTQRLMLLAKPVLPEATGQAGSRAGADVMRTLRSSTLERVLSLGRKAAERLQPAATRRESGIE